MRIKKAFPYQWLSTKPRFETESWGNSEMTCFVGLKKCKLIISCVSDLDISLFINSYREERHMYSLKYQLDLLNN